MVLRSPKIKFFVPEGGENIRDEKNLGIEKCEKTTLLDCHPESIVRKTLWLSPGEQKTQSKTLDDLTTRVTEELREIICVRNYPHLA